MKSLFGPQKRVVLLDWSNFVWRALSIEKEPEEFLRILLKMLAKYRKLFDSFTLVVALEGDGAEARRRLLPAYKAHRAHHEEVGELMEAAAGVLRCLQAVVIRAGRGEADDAIASYVAQHVGAEDRAIIVSEDHDLWAMIRDPSVEVWSHRMSVRMSEALVKHKLGVVPTRIRMLKALVGDTSDNIPRVPRLSTKSAVEMARRAATLKDLWKLLRDGAVGKPHEIKACLSCKKQIRLSYAVCGLKTNLRVTEREQRAKPKRLRQYLIANGVFGVDKETIQLVVAKRG